MTGSRSRHALSMLAALLGVIVLARWLFDSPESPSAPTVEDADAGIAESNPVAPSIAPDRTVPRAAAPTGGDPPDAAVREEVASERAPDSLPFGWVRLDATFVGRTPRASVYTAIFVRHDRCGSAEYPAPADTPLSAGRWRGELRSAGYETIPLPEFPIEEGKTTDLGRFVFEPGSATLHGALRDLSPTGATGGSPWFVDLFGGELPTCESCPFSEEGVAQPCQRCGRIDDRWRRELPVGGEFAFTGLLAGRYRLHAHRPGSDDAGVEEWIELARGSARFVDLVVAPPRELSFELFDPDGLPFTGILARDGERTRAPIRFTIRREGRAGLTASILPDLPSDARLEPHHEVRFLISRAMLEITYRTEFAVSLSQHVRAAPPYVDRPNADPAVAIAPRAAAAGGDVVLPASRRDGDPPNRVRVAGLPPEVLTVTVRCDQYGSDPIVIDARLPWNLPIRVVMKPIDAPPEQEVEVLLDADASGGETPRISFDGSGRITLHRADLELRVDDDG